jgi:ankyrin repeat protein
MRLLLDHGASVELANNDGVTPLRQTLFSRPFSVAATELLLARGANSEAKMKNGKTVREFAHLVCRGADKAIGDLFDKYSKAEAG